MADTLAQEYCERLWQEIYDNTHKDGTPYGLNPDTGEELTAWDYLEDVLDIVYSVGGDRKYRGARILIGYGGPNVWIDTNSYALEVYWSETATRYLPSEFIDGLDSVLEEMWEVA